MATAKKAAKKAAPKKAAPKKAAKKAAPKKAAKKAVKRASIYTAVPDRAKLRRYLKKYLADRRVQGDWQHRTKKYKAARSLLTRLIRRPFGGKATFRIA